MFITLVKFHVVSIHTPTKGVTTATTAATATSAVSIHTPTKGVTQVIKGTITQLKVSIHTPTKGVTLKRFRL